MPIIANAKHELFAQELAKGVAACTAYVNAGFKANDGNAIRLKGNERIQARIEEILGKAAERAEITVYDIATQLDEDRTFARELEAPAAAISATMGKAKVLGLLVDRSEVTGKDGGPIETVEMSDRDTAKAIAFALARGLKQPTAH